MRKFVRGAPLFAAAFLWAAAAMPAGAQAPKPSTALERWLAALKAAWQQQQTNLQLAKALRDAGFTGRVEADLERRLGRRLDEDRADLGRQLFFDRILSLKGANACAGCHSPTAAFADTQSIAIGIDNNNVVGPNRAGPRNQRRTPTIVNSAFYPALMWNSRFFADSGNPFDNRAGFTFPEPEGLTLSAQPHLLTAQAFIPPTERNEMAGFEFVGHNDALRAAVVQRLNDAPNYRRLFNDVFGLGRGGRIAYEHLAAALAEFQFALTFADAPIDRFARGHWNALSADEKQGALLFFGKANCVSCHAVGGGANEMFSDFVPHVLGVPQVAPRLTNSTFDGPRANEDFGQEQVTGRARDRYAFRTSPLRNIGAQPTYFHNGAFTRLEDAIAHHLDVRRSARSYDPARWLDRDLAGPTGPIEPVLARLDARVRQPTTLTGTEFRQLVAFVRTGLLDDRATAPSLIQLVPRKLPSGLAPLRFEFE